MIRKYEDRYVTSIAFERSVYFKLNALLPKGFSITDEINEFLNERLERLEDLERDRIINATNNGPIRIKLNTKINTNSACEQSVEHRLDIYGPKKDLVTHVQKISDCKTAWNLKRNAQLLCDLAKTRAKDLQRENK